MTAHQLEAIRLRMHQHVATLKKFGGEGFHTPVTANEVLDLLDCITGLQAELVSEAARTAEQKLRADQMTRQHAAQAAMNTEARHALAALAQRQPLSFKRINELEAESGLDHYKLVRLVERELFAKDGAND